MLENVPRVRDNLLQRKLYLVDVLAEVNRFDASNLSKQILFTKIGRRDAVLWVKRPQGPGCCLLLGCLLYRYFKS
jgi:hypothetical protein